MVLADSGRITRVPPYLGFPPVQQPISPTGLSPSVARLSRRLGYQSLVHLAAPLPQPNFLSWFGLFRVRSPLLAESLLFSFPPGTEMFHFPGFARSCLFIQHAVRQHYLPWVSPFGYRRINAWLAAPRRFSQLPTSFFASCRLGIHRVPFVAWSLFSSRPRTRAQDQGPFRSALALTGPPLLPTSSLSCAYALVKDLRNSPPEWS